MEKTPDLLKIIGTVGITVLIPTIGYIYTQGQDNKSKEFLVSSNQELNQSVKSLTGEINTLTNRLTAQVVKAEYNEKRIDSLEARVTTTTHAITAFHNGVKNE